MTTTTTHQAMRPLRKLPALAAALVLSGPVCGQATHTWNEPLGGNWCFPAHWLQKEVPGRGDVAEIALIGEIVVSLGCNADVCGLLITNPLVTLEIPGGRILELGSCGLENTGSILVNSNASTATASVHVGAFTQTTISGTGVLRLNSLNDAKVTTFPGSTLTNAKNHTIAGFGQISAELINYGLVVADDRFSRELRLTNATKQNNGTMMATRGGILSLFSGIVRGGVLDTSDGGSINGGLGDGAMVEQITLLGNMNLSGGRSITIGPLGLINDGVIVVNSNASTATARVHVGVSTETTISGTGVLRLNSLTRAKVSTFPGSTLTNAAGHTIAGVGAISGELINEGLVVADISGNELRLTVSPKQNNATMMATNGGILSLFSGVVRGGVLDTFKGGSIDGGTGDGAMVEDITLAATGNMNLRAGRSITIGPLGLINNGVILVNSDPVCCATARVHVGVSTETTISGTGVLRLNHVTRAQVTTFPDSTLTNAMGHTIAGFGTISAELINYGLVVADDLGGSELRLTNCVQNNGTMMAENEGILSLYDGVVRGGMLDTSDDGSIDGGPGDGAMVEDITLAATGNMNLRAGRSITIGPLGLINNGVILVNSNPVCCATARVHVAPDTQTTLSGTGELRLNHLTRAKITIAPRSTLTNGDGHTISGVGEVLGALVNAGTLEPGLPVGSFEIFDAPFTQTTTGRLRILISGSPASNLYGQLHCSNIATLAGIVEVSADGFFPQIGDEYEIVVSDLFIQGEFTGVVAVNLPGLGFELVHDFDRVLLVVVELACPADLDGDGTVGITDFLALLGAWGTDPGGPPDLDGDGNVGITDFLELLAAWGRCP